MATATGILIDSGSWIANRPEFNLEKLITKEYRKGVDYEVDKTGNYYTILSEKLKKIIWPNDYFLYDEAVVAIDRQGKIESWRITAENPRDPYRKFNGEGVKKIMNGFDDSKDNKGNKSNVRHSLQEVKIEEKPSKSTSMVPLMVAGGFLLFTPLLLYFGKKKG